MKLMIKPYNIGMFFLLFFLIEPAYFTTIPFFHQIYNIIGYVIFFGVIVYIFITYEKNLKVLLTRPGVYFVSLFLILFISTYLKQGTLFLVLRDNKAALSLLLLTMIEMNNRPQMYIETVAQFDIYIFINLCTILLFPGGLYQIIPDDSNASIAYSCWFLGYKNPQIRVILPLLFVRFLHDFLNKNKLSVRSWLCMAFAVASTLITQSGTGITGLTVFLGILLIAVFWEKIYKYFFSIKVIIALVIIAVVFFVVNQIQFSNNVLSDVIENFYGKSLTFTARTSIWTSALSLISQAPIIGYGYNNSTGFAELFSFYWPVAHPHNYYLYLFMSGGIILFALFVIIVVYLIKQLKTTNHEIVVKICSAFLSAVFIMGITESLTDFVFLYSMMYICCYIPAHKRILKPTITNLTSKNI